MIRVVATPYGQAALEALAGELAAAKHHDRLAPVTIVVPTNSAGVAARRWLGRRPGGVAGIALVTVVRLAELCGGAALAATGRRPVSTPALVAAFRRALREDAGVFHDVAEHPATEEALVGAHRLLRSLPPDAASAIAGAGRRAADVVRLHRRVVELLAGQWYDEADLLASAAQHARPGSLGTVIVHLPQDLPADQAAFLRRLADGTDVVVIAGLTGDAAADAGVHSTLERLGGAAVGGISIASAIINDATTERLAATDADEEAREVVRLVSDELTAGTPLDRIAVLYPTSEPYGRLLAERLAGAAIASNGASARALHERLAGRFLLAALRLHERGWRRHDVLGLLGSVPMHDRGRPVPVATWERIARRAGVVAGRHEWATRLAELATLRSLDRPPDDGANPGIDRELREIRHLAEFVERFARDTDPAAHLPSWRSHADRAHRLLDRYVAPGADALTAWPDEEREAMVKVRAALDRLGALDPVDPQPSAGRFERALALELAGDLGRRGRAGAGVLVGPLSLAVGLDADVVVVMGLADGLAPSRTPDDPVLPDRDRRRAGPAVPLAAHRPEIAHRHFLAALAGARRRLVLTRPRGDLRRSTLREPSTWLTRLERSGAAATAAERVVPSFAAALVALERPATAQEHRLRTLIATSANDLALLDGPLARSWLLVRNRASSRFTEHDGNLGAVAAAAVTGGERNRLDPAAGVAVTATRLETWVRCPHRYFMTQVLRLRETEHPETILDLEPIEQGNLVHEVLDHFIATTPQPLPRPDEPWDAAAIDRLAAAFEERCQRYEARGLTGHRLYWTSTKRSLWRQLLGFVRNDNARRASLRSTPLASEQAFDDVIWPLSNGTSLRFRGLIDRIDLTDDGTLLVVDYKTGSDTDYRRLSADDPDAGGTRLQLPVYAAAARALATQAGWPVHPDRPVVASYWFLRSVERRNEIGYAVGPEIEERVGRRLEAITGDIAKGVFPSRPSRDTKPWIDCPWCDPDGLGVGDRLAAWDRKRDATELVAYVRLVEGRIDSEADQ